MEALGRVRRDYEGESDYSLQACGHSFTVSCCRRFEVWLWRVACAIDVRNRKTRIRRSSESRAGYRKQSLACLLSEIYG